MSVDMEAEADAIDVTECPHDDMSSTGVYGLPECTCIVIHKSCMVTMNYVYVIYVLLLQFASESQSGLSS